MVICVWPYWPSASTGEHLTSSVFCTSKAQCLRGKHSSKPQGCCSQSSFQHVTWPGKVWNSRPVFIPKTSRACNKVEKCVAKSLVYLSILLRQGANITIILCSQPTISVEEVPAGVATPYAVLQSHPITQSIYLSVCLSVYLSIFLSIYLSICLSIYVYIYVCIYIMCMCIYISDVRGCWHPRVRQCQHRTHN